ncbi:alpha/beta fold hydrolase [Azospirillum thermophilum]|uniref:Alpha/beta hydrolase n=1 Tax=Azospirillum thermophilum TaxID=2202148 RepID=A0A2S2CUM6_9PROT|nr:alpha/beta hydrolase [Azospirillum thermophilum]AWK88115.1 alpha/beta hydrolase [Azospirillum thermophilum]
MTTPDLTSAAENLLRGVRPTLVHTAAGPVECAVEGDGPAILALHGAVGGWDQSMILARAAAPPGHRLVAVSRPGYLGTPLAVGRTPEEQADGFAALLDALGIAQAVVMAVSGGGLNALQFALRHPHRCRALVLVSACSERLRTRIPLRFHLMRLAAHCPPLTRAMRRKVAADPEAAASRSVPDPELRRRTLADPVAGPLHLALMLGMAEGLDRRMPGTRNDIAQSRRAIDYPLRSIACPVLSVHGTADPVVPVDGARRLAATLPRAALMEIDGGGHTVLFTHRERIARRVAGFLAGL